MIPVYSLNGEKIKEIDLPVIFSEEIRPDLIKRAAIAVRSAKFQSKAPYWKAGMQTSAEYVGRRRAYRTMINIARARLPKIKLPKGRYGEVRIVPQARKGRPAHPPKIEKILIEKINKKERRKAIRSAIAATRKKDLIIQRGHKVEDVELPIIIEDSFQKLKKTKEVESVLKKLNLEKEMERGKIKKIRPGRGKMRGRKYKKKKSILLVVSKDLGIINASKNIPGIDVSLAKNLNADLLAPGGMPGRLTIYTESALNDLKKLFQ